MAKFTINPATLAMLLAKRWPTCWAFVSAVLGDRGIPTPVDVGQIMEDPHALGEFVASPRVGDLVVARGDKGAHVGIVLDIGVAGKVAHAGLGQFGRVDPLELFVRHHRYCRFVRLNGRNGA